MSITLPKDASTNGHALDATRLLTHIYGPAQGYMYVFTGRRQDRNTLTDEKQRPFKYPDELPDALAFIDAENDSGRETYFCAHALKPDETGKIERRKAYAADVQALWVERDDVTIPEHLPQPSATVESSPGRYHDYYRLDRPISPNKAEDLNQRLTKAVGGDSGWALTKLLRLPGTNNRKYVDHPEVKLISLSNKVYDPNDIDRLLPQHADVAHDTAADLTGPPVSLDRYELEVWEGKHPVIKDDKIDRSDSLWKIARTLYEANLRGLALFDAVKDRDKVLYQKYIDRNDAAKQYEEIVKRAMAKDPDEPKTDANGLLAGKIDLAQILSQGLPEVNLIVPNLIIEGKVHTIWGRGGTGKSILAAKIAFSATQNGYKVLYLDSENAASDQVERLVGLGATADEISQIAFYSYPDLKLDNVEKLFQTVKSENADLVIFDSWIRFLSAAGLDESSNADVSKWTGAVTDKLQIMGVASLMLDHTPHGGEHAKGAVDKFNNVDVSIKWTAKPFGRNKTNDAILRVEKDRSCRLEEKQSWKIGGDGTGTLHCDFVSIIDQGQGERPAGNNLKALEALEVHGCPVSLTYWTTLTFGDESKKSSLSKARTWLVENGFVDALEVDGKTLYEPTGGGW